MADRARVALVCEVCGARNYQATKAKNKLAERLVLKKFCTACGHHTVHKESK